MSWRVGSKVSINVYDDDRPVCQCQTIEDARQIITAVNKLLEQQTTPKTIEQGAPYTVKIEYYKQSGKFYSEGEYQTDKIQMYDIFLEIRVMLNAGKCPGLVDGPNLFFARVTVPGHPNDCPILIIPESFV